MDLDIHFQAKTITLMQNSPMPYSNLGICITTRPKKRPKAQVWPNSTQPKPLSLFFILFSVPKRKKNKNLFFKNK